LINGTENTSVRNNIGKERRRFSIKPYLIYSLTKAIERSIGEITRIIERNLSLFNHLTSKRGKIISLGMISFPRTK